MLEFPYLTLRITHIGLVAVQRTCTQAKEAAVLIQMWPSARFVGGALSAFLALGAGCHFVFGPRFLQETYFFHLHRKDPRHNFAPYFYGVYVAGGIQGWTDVGW